MNKIPRQFYLPIAFALALHLLLIILLVVQLPATAYRMQANAHATVVKPIAVKAVSSAVVNAQIHAIKKARYEKKMAKIRRQRKIRARALAIKRARMAKAKRIARQKALARARRIKLARQKKEKQLRRKRLKVLKDKQKKLQAQLMRQQLNKEQKALKQASAQAAQGAVDQYKAQILSVVQSNWRIQQVNAKLKCVYEIDVAPGGMVLSVKLVKSSGDSALDASAKVAILKSSPLPVPKDAVLFDRFRQLVLSLSPQGYI